MCGKWDTVTTRKSGHLRPFGTPPHGSQPPNSGPCYKVSLVIRATCLSLPRTHRLHCMAFPLPPRLRTSWALSLPPMPTTTSPGLRRCLAQRKLHQIHIRKHKGTCTNTTASTMEAQSAAFHALACSWEGCCLPVLSR